MQKFTVHTGRGLPLRRTDVDTDQIIPVRFLTFTGRTGYGDALFRDWRDDPGFVMNDPRYEGATVLVASRDFGTGSSREYAVWAMMDFGLRAVIAPRFSDIFRGNALKNGLLAVVVPEQVVERLWVLLDREPAVPITVDLIHRQVRAADITADFPLDDYTRTRLMEGLDETALTLARTEAIDAFEVSRRATLPTTTRRP